MGYSSSRPRYAAMGGTRTQSTWSRRTNESTVCTWPTTLWSSSRAPPLATPTARRPAQVFHDARGLAVDYLNASRVLVYVADRNNHKIRRVNVAEGTVDTVAGSGSHGCMDGLHMSARFYRPTDVALYHPQPDDSKFTYQHQPRDRHLRRRRILQKDPADRDPARQPSCVHLTAGWASTDSSTSAATTARCAAGRRLTFSRAAARAK